MSNERPAVVVTRDGLQYTLIQEDNADTCCMRCILSRWVCETCGQKGGVCDCNAMRVDGCAASDDTPNCRSTQRDDGLNYYVANITAIPVPENLPVIAVAVDVEGVAIGVPEDYGHAFDIKMINWDLDEEVPDDDVVGLVRVPLRGPDGEELCASRAAVHDADVIVLPRVPREGSETSGPVEEALAIYNRQYGKDSECGLT